MKTNSTLRVTDQLPTPENTIIDNLLTDDQRRTVSVSPQKHQAWRESLAPPAIDDDFDDAFADPQLDHLPAYRSGSDSDRLTAILDSLERGEG